MPIEFQKWITRDDLRDNRHKTYVFGDNVARTGFGGQAKEMRGEPNALGVVTKWYPGHEPGAFFNDGIRARSLVERDMNRITKLLNEGRVVVVPADGIGTGLAKLDRYAPKLDAFIKFWFRERAAKYAK
jgi:hypothetical protein